MSELLNKSLILFLYGFSGVFSVLLFFYLSIKLFTLMTVRKSLNKQDTEQDSTW